MNKLFILLTIGILGTWLTGCGSDEGTSNTAASPSVAPSPAASPAPTMAVPSASVSPSPFATPLITPSNTAVSDAGLIQSTNPDQQVKQLEKINQNSQAPRKSIPDPFSPVFPQSSIDPFSNKSDQDQSKLTTLTARKVPTLPELPTIAPPRFISNTPVPVVIKTPGTQARPQPVTPGIKPRATTPPPPRIGPNTAPRPKSSPAPNNGQEKLPIGATEPVAVPDLPKLPVGSTPPQWVKPTFARTAGPKPILPPNIPPVAIQPVGVPDLPKLPVGKEPPAWEDPNPPVVEAGPTTDTAEGIEVSGVVQVGENVQVIVKVPEEATTRYVSIGQRLANGQVLVKKVDFNNPDTPLVILEENGIEITKLVGEKPVGSDDDKKANTGFEKPTQVSSNFTK